MKTISGLTFCFVLMVSCGEERSMEDKSVTLSTSKNDIVEKFEIDTFAIFPPEVEGCSCYFSSNQKEFKEARYLYVDDSDSSAYVKIKGSFTRFMLIQEKEISPEHRIKRFKNGNIELTLDIKQVSQIDETWQQKGTLKISSAKGDIFTKLIYGECGC